MNGLERFGLNNKEILVCDSMNDSMNFSIEKEEKRKRKNTKNTSLYIKKEFQSQLFCF